MLVCDLLCSIHYALYYTAELKNTDYMQDVNLGWSQDLLEFARLVISLDA